MAEKNNFKAFEAALKQDNTNLYIFSDKEPYFREKAEEMLRRQILGEDDMNDILLDGDSLTPEALSEAVDAPPIFAPRKLIRVHRFAPSSVSAEDGELYLSVLSDIPDYAVVLLMLAEPAKKGRGGDSNALAKGLSKLSTPFEFETPTPGELAKLIQRMCRAAEKGISPSDADYFISLCAGSDTQTVLSEAKKLLSVSRDEIRREDIDSLISLSPDAASYLITGAIFDGDSAKAITLYRNQIKKGVSEYVLSSVIFSDLKRYYTVKLGMGAGIPEAELLKFLSISDKRLFVLKKIVARVDVPRLRRSVTLAADNEYALRSSSGDGVLETELLIMKLCVLLGRRM
ncbi:MAG: DNA polymerase III subunit delta [Clostridia bacterium]|nr:DNA polymerase III subunit delta [Clostridia bacterium]